MLKDWEVGLGVVGDDFFSYPPKNPGLEECFGTLGGALTKEAMGSLRVYGWMPPCRSLGIGCRCCTGVGHAPPPRALARDVLPWRRVVPGGWARVCPLACGVSH